MRLLVVTLVLCAAFLSTGTAQDTVQVFAGWNIIGSVTSGNASEILTTIPSEIIQTSFFGYSPDSGYNAGDSISRGFGYWVKVSADGIIIFGNSTSPGPCGTKTMTYAGERYPTVLIGAQCWLAKNLNVGTMSPVATDESDNGTVEKHCYNDNPPNCMLYGGLYTWDEAMQYVTFPGARGICPPGWHIPSIVEFEALREEVGLEGLHLMAEVTDTGLETNESGFSALFAGGGANDGPYDDLGTHAYFWSSSEVDVTIADLLRIKSTISSITLDSY